MKKKLLYLILLLTPLIYLISCNKAKEFNPSGTISYEATYDTLKINVSFNEDASSLEKYKLELNYNESIVSSAELGMNTTSYTFKDLNDGVSYKLSLYLYYEDSFKILCSINLSTRAKPSMTSAKLLSKDVTYDSQDHTLEVTGIENLVNPTITFTDELGNITYNKYTQNMPGEYKVICLITSDNYKDITLTATLRINKAQLTNLTTFKDLMFDYNGKEYVPFKYSNLDYTFYNNQGKRVDKIVDVGEYIVHYSFDGDEYYESISGQYNVVINKTEISLNKGSVSLTLDEAKSYTLTKSSFNAPIQFTYKIFKPDFSQVSDFKNINSSGTYTVLIYAKETDNYYLYKHAYNLYVNVTNTKLYNEADLLTDLSTISKSRITLLDNVMDSKNSTPLIDKHLVNESNVNDNVNVFYSIGDLKFVLTLYMLDEEKPIIDITDKARKIKIGENVDFTTFFTAEDQIDGEIKITSENLDLSEVDILTSGVYKIIVSVSDSSGNVAEYIYNLYVELETIHVSDYTTKRLDQVSNFMPSTGNVNVLVVPIDIEDSNLANKSDSTRVDIDETYLSNINKVFNGNNGDLDFESVKSYYYKSSFGKLNLNFDISPVIACDYVASNYDSVSGFYRLISEVMNKLSSIDFTKYDANNDSYIDSIWFVYNVDYKKESEIFWAITATHDLNDIYDGKLLRNFSFASHNFMYSSDSYNELYNKNTQTNLVARTYIHETGHLLGLQDYYVQTKDSVKGNSYYMYGQSMMDRNMLDLDTATKTLLGWVDPIICNTNSTITINAASKTGDAILIKKEYSQNNTIYDEYIMLELFTNDNLNNLDYDKSFNKYGIRILHVDFKLSGTYFVYDNNRGNFSIKTLPFGKVTYENQNPVITNVLFDQTGIVFGTDFYKEYTYKDGSNLDFTFEIKEINNEFATIAINF